MKDFEQSKKNVTEQQKEAIKTENVIRSIEKDALNFKPKPCGKEDNENFKTHPDVMAMTRDMNRVGLNANNSYNHDKYGKKGASHNYSLIGDVLRPGMEFNTPRNQTQYQIAHGNSAIHRPLNQAKSARRASPHSVVQLPANIRHQFGSRICDSLLSDPKVVEQTVESQKAHKEQMKRASKPLNVPTMEKELKPEYESIGNAMRMNVFPGYNINHKISTMKTSFDDSVHLRRYPDPEQWRYQRDELSKYIYPCRPM